jgi:hypothetical protein
MGITSFNQGFKIGYHYTKGLPTVDKIGRVFWVGKNDTAPAEGIGPSNRNPGTPLKPFATIAYASSRCTANQGDTIYVYPGHIESVVASGTLTLTVAGITIIFLGNGSNRATIDFSALVTASVIVSADDITFIAPRFTASIDALTGPIAVGAANFKIFGAEWNDGIGIDTTNCLITGVTATGLTIKGWKYIAGDEAGTQKQSNIQLNGVDNAVLEDIDITGDFSDANIENITDEVLNIRLKDIMLNNLNATPTPGLVLDAASSGWAKNVDIRVASGTTYVSSVALLNWDPTCLGYNTDGKGGTAIATFA